MHKHFKPLLLILVLLAIDLITKYIFYSQGVAASSFLIEPAFNLGISRSLQVPMLVTIAVGCISLILFGFAYYQKYISWIIAALLIAGTLGNLADRIFLHGVRDFISIGSRFPIFNAADIFLNIGILWYIIKEFSAGQKPTKQ